MPRMTQATAVKTRERKRLPPAALIIMSPKTTPMPVRAVMATTMPAQAQPMTMDMALKPVFTREVRMCLGRKRFFLSKSMMMGTAVEA